MAKNLTPFVLILLLPLHLSEAHQPSMKDQTKIGGSLELWCVAKNNADDSTLQSALDWACGAGGADCGPIQLGGSCYDSSNVQNMASFAFNDYFLKHGSTDDSCFFQNAAAITSLNPSYRNCKFASSLLKNGNYSSETAAVGLGPSEDISNSDCISRVWIWLILIGHFCLNTRIMFG